MSPTKLAVVIVPGAWHGPIHFKNITDRLEQAGYEAIVVKTPSVGPVALSDPLARDIAATKTAIRNFTSAGKNVVVATHSYGGVVGSEAVAEIFEEDKEASQSNGRVVHLFYIAAVIIPKGITVIDDKITAHVLSVEDGLFYHIEPYYRFYQHCDLPAARKAIEAIQPQAVESFMTKTKYAGWADYGIPVTYLACKQDCAIEYDPHMVIFKKRFEEAGVKELDWRESDTDHSPWMSREEEFWGILQEVLAKAGGR